MESPEVSIDVLRVQHLNSDFSIEPISANPTRLYRSLPVSVVQRTIRVFDLDALPRSSDPDDLPLSGRLRVVSLNTTPTYAALSYVWGDYSRPTLDVVNIRTDDTDVVPFFITVNCRDALRSLRRQFGNISIWIDAICINQSDEVEKGSQVSLMGDIYTWSQVVYVWLGQHTQKSRNLFPRLRHDAKATHFFSIILWAEAKTWKDWLRGALLFFIAELRRNGRELWDLQCMSFAISIFSFVYIPILLYVGYMYFISMVMPGQRSISVSHCIQRLFRFLNDNHPMMEENSYGILEHPWLKRGWTFQEIILAPNVVFLRSFDSISWSTIFCGLMTNTTIRDSSAPLDHVFAFANYRWHEIFFRGAEFDKLYQWNITKSREWFAGEYSILEDLFGIWAQIERPILWDGLRLTKPASGRTTVADFQAEALRFMQRPFPLALLNISRIISLIALVPFAAITAAFLFLGSVFWLVLGLILTSRWNYAATVGVSASYAWVSFYIFIYFFPVCHTLRRE